MPRPRRDLLIWLVSTVVVLGVAAFCTAPAYHFNAAAAYAFRFLGADEFAARHAEAVRDSIAPPDGFCVNCIMNVYHERRAVWQHFADDCRGQSRQPVPRW